MNPGIQGQVSFKVNRHEGFSVPDTAVIYQGKDTFVRIVDQNKVKLVPVVLGKKQRGNIEITKGLSPDVTLVERSSRFVSDGETVTIESLQKL
jgi:multidrug efflux pump subunit AcrA (membrane-fusion protein)